jgi:hypothetical protein
MSKTRTPVGGTHTIFDHHDVLLADGVYSPGDDSTAYHYLEVMVAEYAEQRDIFHRWATDSERSDAERQHFAHLSVVHEARRAAYEDAIRVLDIAIDMAFRDA